MVWEWYGVKTLYITHAVGKPRQTDRYFDPEVSLLEERVVIFRARSFEEALSKGEKEARRYASESTVVNRYGQPVRQRYLNVADAYVLSDPPGHGKEVFSRTELVSSRESHAGIAKARLPHERRQDRWRRTKFLNSRYFGSLGRRVV